ESWLDPNRTNLQAIRLLAALLGIIFALTVGCVAVPLFWRAQRGSLRGSLPLLGFFLAIGLGFMFVEIAEMQRLMVLLGKPTYALSVVLFTLLAGSGAGSLASGRLTGRGGALSPGAALSLLMFVLAVVGLLTPALIPALSGASTPAR